MRETCGACLREEKIVNDFIRTFAFDQTMGLLAMANSVHWIGRVLRRDDGHALRRH